MPSRIIPLKSNPGIKRDGTRFEGDFYVDGQWVRFQRGLPRKIGGYRSIVKTLGAVSRGVSAYVQDQIAYFHSGSASTLERLTLDADQISSTVTDRTPTTLVDSDANKWMFDTQYESSAAGALLLAHVAPNQGSITNSLDGQIFSGDVTGTGVLTEITLPAGANATGGIVSIHPYLMYYGTNGIIGWSVPGDPTDLSGSGSGIARPWGQKIIKGLPLRAGGSSGPSAIFWAYDAVLRASFVGDSAVFAFDVLATDTSILSPDCVVDMDGVFYWVGVDRFLMFNGVVREVPNTLNLNWFFDGLNKAQSTKVFAFKVTRYGEIWWCYPRGTATECTHAVIFNVREGTWYDTELPTSRRTAGVFCNLFAAPILVSDDGTNTYRVWVQEQGMDSIDGIDIQPIQSFFETGDMSAQAAQGTNEKLRISRIEPDFVQNGPMSVVVAGRANARAPEVVGNSVTFQDSAATSYDETVALMDLRREMRIRFVSNAVGGSYQMGQVLVHLSTGDKSVNG